MTRTLDELNEQIEAKRAEMVTVGIKIGLAHPDTVRISQELDELLNEHARLTKEFQEVERDMNPIMEQELQNDLLNFDSSFKIENAQDLSYAMRKLAAYKEKTLEIKELADSEIKRIKEWQTKELEQISGKIAYYEALASEYANNRRMQDKKFKSETTPYGRITFTKQPLKWDYVDEAETVEFLQTVDSLAEHIKVEKKIADKTKIKKAIEVKKSVFVKDGQVIDIGLEMKDGWQGLQYSTYDKEDGETIIVDMNTGDIAEDVTYYEIAPVADGNKVVPGIKLINQEDKVTVTLA